MLGSVLLCCCSISLLHLSSALVHGNLQLDDGRHPDPAYLSDLGQYACPITGQSLCCVTSLSHDQACSHVVLCPTERAHAPDPMRDPALLSVDSVEDHFLIDTGSYDEVGVADVETQCR